MDQCVMQNKVVMGKFGAIFYWTLPGLELNGGQCSSFPFSKRCSSHNHYHWIHCYSPLCIVLGCTSDQQLQSRRYISSCLTTVNESTNFLYLLLRSPSPQSFFYSPKKFPTSLRRKRIRKTYITSSIDGKEKSCSSVQYFTVLYGYAVILLSSLRLIIRVCYEVFDTIQCVPFLLSCTTPRILLHSMLLFAAFFLMICY